MRNRMGIVACVLACLSMSTAGFAQDEDRPEQELAAELEESKARMREARYRLEQAAQEIAALSARHAAPVMRNVYISGADFTMGRPMLGINIEDAEGGVRVVGITPNGPAAEAGVEAEDVLVAIDGHALVGTDEATPTRLLMSQLTVVEPGATLGLDLRRGGEELRVDVETRELSPSYFTADTVRMLPAMPTGPDVHVVRGRSPGGPGFNVNAMFMPGFAGEQWRSMELVELTPALGEYFGAEQGLLVVRAPENDGLQLIDGDVIVAIGDRTPTSTEHAMRILRSFEPGEELEMTIIRKQRRQTISLELPTQNRGATVLMH